MHKTTSRFHENRVKLFT